MEILMIGFDVPLRLLLAGKVMNKTRRKDAKVLCIGSG
jgi:hypothetical protein